MQNLLVNNSDINIRSSIRIRTIHFFHRKIKLFLKTIKLNNIYFLYEKKFRVIFSEENGLPIKTPLTGDYWRSVNLFDQREALHRALIAHAIKQEIINPSKNIIDAGAQNGDCALAWAKMINGIVYAIDPSPRNLAFIQNITKLNNIANLKTLNFALGNSDGYLYPYYDIDHTPFSTVPTTKFSKKNRVKSTTLDKLNNLKEIDSLGFIHLDVEGMELQVLQGSLDTLKKFRPILTFEAHITIDDIESIFALLKSINYHVYMINESTPGGRPDCINFIALPENKNLDASIKHLNSVKPAQVYYKATIGENLIPVH